MRLTGNTVLISGGGTGIGLALAGALLAVGNDVVITGRREKVLQEAAERFPGLAYLKLDQSEADEVVTAARRLRETYPQLNVLVNNAGIQRPERIAAGDVRAAEETIATNLLGPVRMTAALLPSLMRRPHPTIVNVTSALAFVPQATTPTYCATKAAMHSYTQSLREQLRGAGVHVLEIIPPKVQTALQGAAGFDPAAMPIDDYVREVMALLRADPEAEEIVVPRAAELRYAARDRAFHERFRRINAASGDS